MNRTSSASRRRLERGQITWVTAVLLLSVAGALYLSAVWAPVYILHQEVKQVTRDFMNRSVKNRAAEALLADMCSKIRSLDSEDGEDPAGRRVKLPVVDLQPNEVTWERDDAAKTLHVSFEYVRVVRYPWIDRSEEKVMTVDLTTDITIPKW
jgi:hypothetical protein